MNDLPQPIMDALLRAHGSHAAASAAVGQFQRHRQELHAAIDDCLSLPSPTAQLVAAAAKEQQPAVPPLPVGPAIRT